MGQGVDLESLQNHEGELWVIQKVATGRFWGSTDEGADGWVEESGNAHLYTDFDRRAVTRRDPSYPLPPDPEGTIWIEHSSLEPQKPEPSAFSLEMPYRPPRPSAPAETASGHDAELAEETVFITPDSQGTVVEFRVSPLLRMGKFDPAPAGQPAVYLPALTEVIEAGEADEAEDDWWVVQQSATPDGDGGAQ